LSKFVYNLFSIVVILANRQTSTRKT